MYTPDRVLLFCQSTALAAHRSGIHRVTVELARALPTHVAVDLVCWNALEGQLRYMDQREVGALFQGQVPDRIGIRMEARRVNGRFGDTLKGQSPWLLFPEIPYHMDRGNETFARILTQCREYRMPTAAIYYDAIPVTNAHYAEWRRPHVDYLVELTRVDRILPISETSGVALMDLFRDARVSQTALDGFAERLHPVLLPEGKPGDAAVGMGSRGADNAARDTILMIGTVEPRKQQVEVLEAINAACAGGGGGALDNLRVDIVGSLHPATADRLQAAQSVHGRVTVHNHISDAHMAALYDRALFTVFASNDEGYGLPIAESLVRGVPCLTANFGSMQEVANGGGCLTVHVNDPEALQAGLRQMADDAELRDRLCAEIAARDFRSWGDYAGDILSGMSLPGDVPERSKGTRARLAFAELALDKIWQTQTAAFVWNAKRPKPGPDPQRVVAALWSGDAGGFAALEPAARRAVYCADVAGFADDASYRAALEACAEDDHAGLFAPRVVIASAATERLSRMEDALRQVAQDKARRLKFAAEERLYMELKAHFAPDGVVEDRVLSLVISTYNRSAFVTANAHWLADQVDRLDGKVDLTVVDNASTDDSWAALQSLAGRRGVTLIQNPANTGMLGNLNVCSTLPLARHVWVTGDDDFIKPEALDAVVAQLERTPGLPLAFVNFAVYHRAALSPTDTAKGLQAEGTPLSPDPAPDGLRLVSEIATEHDNLFTAVYPIIWRSDILAACFNYPFTGIPFVDLVESVPTTKIILESYGQCMAYWHGGIGTVGNAHNSWSRHRPRWHALLMPLVFEAARDAGVTDAVLRPWADLHFGFFADAVEIARDQAMPVHFDGALDLVPGTRVFRKPVEVPADLARWQDPATREWDGT